MDRQICPEGHFGITRLSRVMPNCDPRDRFVYSYFTRMMDFVWLSLVIPDTHVIFLYGVKCMISLSGVQEKFFFDLLTLNIMTWRIDVWLSLIDS